MGWSIIVSVVTFAACTTRTWATATNSKTSLTLLYQNNLNATDDANHIGAILLDPSTQTDVASACATFGEKLLSKAAIQNHEADFIQQLGYVSYSGRGSPMNTYYIDGGIVSFDEYAKNLEFPSSTTFKDQKLPILCTQSSQENQASNAVATPANEVSIQASGNTYVGFRNQKSFRFLGIRYADKPARFEYSKTFSGTGQTFQATQYGSVCAQGGGGSEDCLFLNIQTPYIPKAGSKVNLRPVHFYIHGGGFTSGTGADPSSDGGNLASKEDIVVVTINYRLSTLGFLAIPGTDIKGNFGIGDQIQALKWTVANIEKFGGDPKHIVINGASAGAGSVRALLGSPLAIPLFQGAMAMSNLGGGVSLGLGGDYATTYSDYYTIDQSYAVAGQNIFTEAGCRNTTLVDLISCLKAVDPLKLIGFGNVARYVVQDGTYVVTDNLKVGTKNDNVAHVPVIFGVVRDDGAEIMAYPRPPVTSELAGIQASLSISASYAQSIIDSGLFPYYDTGNVTLDSFNVSVRVSTDIQFRCIDQATVYAGVKSGAFKKAWFYQMDRSWSGYDPNGLGGPKDNDPNNPYFRIHGSEMPNVFGNLDNVRNLQDLQSIRTGTSYFGAFTRQLQPNPSKEYLEVRGYDDVIAAVKTTGTWDNVRGQDGPIRHIDYPPSASGFVDVPQCAFLDYPINYYLKGK